MAVLLLSGGRFVFWILRAGSSSANQRDREPSVFPAGPFSKIHISVVCGLQYGQCLDPLWGYSRDLKYASSTTIDELFLADTYAFSEPLMPKNAPPTALGLHGAVWFETLYQDSSDRSGHTLFALYHNENYPFTLPYYSATGEGYLDKNWPEVLRGPESKTAICRIGIMKTVDGGKQGTGQGILLHYLQPRQILRPHNIGINFAGGTGDPSAVASGDLLYIF